MDLTTINTIGTILGCIAALSAIIAGIVAAVWWASSMYHETKASRVANETGVNVLHEKLTTINNTLLGHVGEIKGEVVEHRGRIISLEEWRAVIKSREADTELEPKARTE